MGKFLLYTQVCNYNIVYYMMLYTQIVNTSLYCIHRCAVLRMLGCHIPSGTYTYVRTYVHACSLCCTTWFKVCRSMELKFCLSRSI